MQSSGISLNEKEKALVYIIRIQHYLFGQVAFLGIVFALLTLFAGTPDYGAVITPFLGFMFGYLDIYFSFYFITQRTGAYLKAFERLTLIWPYRNILPFSLFKRKVKLFSEERKRLCFLRIRTFILYESYKIAIPLIFSITAFLTSKRAEAIMFNWGLSIFFWELSYLLLWKKKYLLKTAEALGIKKVRLNEIINYLKNNYGYA